MSGATVKPSPISLALKATKVKPIANLVQLSPNLLAPVTLEDNKALTECGYLATKIPAATLGLLRTTVLKNIAIRIRSWEEVSEGLFDQFRESLTSIPDVKVKKDKDDPEVVLMFWKVGDAMGAIDLGKKSKDKDDTPALPNEAVFRKALDERCNQMRQYLGQYCRTLSVHHQDRPDLGGRVYRLSCVFDESLPNSMFYTSVKPVPTCAYLNLSTAYRVKFELDTLNTHPIFRIQGEDLIGGEWQPAQARSFHKSQVKGDSIVSVVNFMLTHLLDARHQ